MRITIGFYRSDVNGYPDVELKVNNTAVKKADGKRMVAAKILGIDHKGRWNAETQRMDGTDDYALAVNDRLNHIETGLNAAYQRLLKTGIPTAHEIMAAYFGAIERPVRTFFQVVLEYREAKDLSLNTWKVYDINIRAKMKDFFKRTWGVEDVEMRVFDLPTLYRFEVFLKQIHLKPSTAAEYVNKFKAILAFSKQMGYIGTNPYEDYNSGTIGKGNIHKAVSILDRKISPENLRKIEITEIPNTKFHARVENFWRVRMLFLFQTWTGMSYVDLTTYNPKNLFLRDLSGRDSFVYNRMKNGEIAIVPVHQELRDILEKLEWDINPYTNYPTTRRNWQSLFKYYDCYYPGCGTHTGRHVFGERMISMGYSMEAVSRMLGHSSIEKTEKVYAKIDTTKIMAEYSRVATADTPTMELSRSGT